MSTADNSARIAGDVPNDRKRALEHLALEKSTIDNRCSLSSVLRDAVDEYLQRHYDELPEEGKDTLPDNFGGN